MVLININKRTDTKTVTTKNTSVGSGGAAAAKIVIPKMTLATNFAFFGNNATSYYKLHSLSTGVGSVRNNRHKRGNT
jgi:hypothetical protein